MAKTHDPVCVLGIFAKQPRPGFVKTRLASETSPEWAAEAATAFLKDLVTRFAQLRVRRVIAFDPVNAQEWFGEIVKRDYQLVPQSQGDLGIRLVSFLREQFNSGAERVVLIGIDSPTLPLSFVENAFDELKNAEVVLGPAVDGGYYLIGLGRFVPELFTGIDWSGSRVLRDTVARIRENNLVLSLLPPWYDVDTIDDWWMLRGHISAMRQAGAEPDVPHTKRFIETCDEN